MQNVTVMAGDGELMVTWDEHAAVGLCADAAAGAHHGYLVEWPAMNQSFDNPDQQMKVREMAS